MNPKNITRGLLRGTLMFSLLAGVCGSASATDDPAHLPAPSVNNTIPLQPGGSADSMRERDSGIRHIYDAGGVQPAVSSIHSNGK
jgi:hypothetical protein